MSKTRQFDGEPKLRGQVPGNGPADQELLIATTKALGTREYQLMAIRRAMTLPLWAAVCEALPEAREWFDDEGRLR